MKNFRSFLLFMLFSTRLFAQPDPEFSLPSIHLTDSIFCTEVKDQSQSPTCWVFGTNSLFESDLAKKHNLRLNLSEMFIARYAYIDKARQWLVTKGKTYFEGGGQFHDVIRIINKYGIVPEDAYNGKPRREFNHNHAQLDTAMKRFANELIIQGKTELSTADMQQLNDTLDRYLGKVPETFWYNGKQFNPKTFALEIDLSAEDYIEVMSFDNLPYYQKCLLADKFNWADDSLYNIPLKDLQWLVDTALSKGWSVGWEGDVTEPGFNYWSGFATTSYSIHQFSDERLTNFKNETWEAPAGMSIIRNGTT
jgi:bleomycin hydrolase